MYLYANNAVTTFASPIGTTDTSMTVAPGTGALFPAITGSDSFLLTLLDSATKTKIEIVLVTARAGDVFTIVRAQDGTTARAYLSGDIVSQRVVAQELRDFASKTFGGTFSAPIYAPPAAVGDNSTQVATTAWVVALLASKGIT